MHDFCNVTSNVTTCLNDRKRDTKLGEKSGDTDLSLETCEAPDPEDLARPALDGIVRAGGVVRVVRHRVLLQVGRVQRLGGTGADPELLDVRNYLSKYVKLLILRKITKEREGASERERAQ